MALIQVNAIESRTFLLTCTRKLLILRLLSSRRATGSALPSIATIARTFRDGSDLERPVTTLRGSGIVDPVGDFDGDHGRMTNLK